MMIFDRHLEIPKLTDGDLELRLPSRELAESFAVNSAHPLVYQEFPMYAGMTEEELRAWVEKVNGGRHFNKEPRCPVYWFWMVTSEAVVGDLELRITVAESALMASGHVGYHVLPQFRGRGYATAALRLGREVFREHGFEEIIVTCGPENLASRRVIEKAGGELVEVRRFSEEEKQRFHVGADEICRYELDLTSPENAPGTTENPTKGVSSMFELT